VTQLQASNSSASQLSATVSAHTTQIASLQAGQTSCSSQINALQADNATVYTSLSALQQRVSAVEGSAATLNTRLSAAESLTASSSTLVNAVSGLLRSNQSSSVSIISLSSRMSLVESALQSSNQNASVSSASVLYRLSAVEGTSTSLLNRMQAAETLTTGSSALVSTVQALQAANSSLQMAEYQFSASLTQLRTQVTSLQASSSVQITALNSSAQATLALVSTQLNVYNSQITALQAANTSIQASVSLVSAQLAIQATQISALQSANTSVQSAAVVLTQRVTSIDANLISLSARISAAESLTAGSSVLVNVVTQLQASNSSASQLSATVSAHTTQIASLQAGQTSCSSQINAVNVSFLSQAAMLTLKLLSLERNVSSLNSRVSAAESLSPGSSALVKAVQFLQSSSSSSSSLVSVYSVSAVAGSSSAIVSWSLATFTVQATPGGSQCVSLGGTSCTVPGLTNGRSYTFNVTARNFAGDGPTSAFTKPVIPTLVCVSMLLATSGPGTVYVSPNVTTQCGYMSFPVGSLVTLTAEAADGFTYTLPPFTGTLTGISNPFSFVIPADFVEILSSFSCIALTLDSNNPLDGSAVVSPTNSALCPSGFFLSGTTVTLTATSSLGYPFAYFNGSVSQTTSNPLVVTMNAAPLSVRANFFCFPLSVLSSDITRGNVSFTPARSGGCGAGLYASGTSVSLTAISASAYVFALWSGAQSTEAISFNFVTGVTPASEVASFLLKATVVYGQGGDFTSGSPNIPSPNANTLDAPACVLLDSSGNLYGK
jgi:hypothetical protein